MKQKMTIKEDLRNWAETMLMPEKNPCSGGSPVHVRRLINQLLTHQVELELQNKELRHTRARLEAMCNRYADLYDFAPIGQFAFDRSGTILQANLTCAELLRTDRSRLINHPFGGFVAAQSQAAFKTFLQRVFTGRSKETCELVLAGKAEDALPVRLEGSVPEFAGLCHAVVFDIHRDKPGAAEKAETEAQRCHAQMMESVGRLAGGVAHDFNNMMCVIIGHAELALEDMPPTSSLHRDLQEIRTAAYRSADLTQELLAFAGKQIASPKVLDLNEGIAEAMGMLRQVTGEDVDLLWLPDRNLWKVEIDPCQLELILNHLVRNARDAVHGQGSITIATGNVTLDDARGIEREAFAAGEYVLLSLSDTGCGIARETLEHIFEPFFTTKEVGSGTGLGLAAIHGIVRQNNGFIQVNSTVGRGTTFEIYLPRCKTLAADVGFPDKDAGIQEKTAVGWPQSKEAVVCQL